jgi:hypothetical protein
MRSSAEMESRHWHSSRRAQPWVTSAAALTAPRRWLISSAVHRVGWTRLLSLYRGNRKAAFRRCGSWVATIPGCPLCGGIRLGLYDLGTACRPHHLLQGRTVAYRMPRK